MYSLTSRKAWPRRPRSFPNTLCVARMYSPNPHYRLLRPPSTPAPARPWPRPPDYDPPTVSNPAASSSSSYSISTCGYDGFFPFFGFLR